MSQSHRFATSINEQNLEPRQNVDRRWIFTLNVHTSIHLHPGLQEVQGSYQCWNSLPLCFVEYTGGQSRNKTRSCCNYNITVYSGHYTLEQLSFYLKD